MLLQEKAGRFWGGFSKSKKLRFCVFGMALNGKLVFSNGFHAFKRKERDELEMNRVRNEPS